MARALTHHEHEAQPPSSDPKKGYKILLLAGIIIVALCVLGIMVQWPVYAEHSAALGRTFHADGASTTGFDGPFMQSIVAWNKSGAAAGQAALYTMIFLGLAAIVGAALIIWSAYKILKPVPQVRPAHEPEEVDMRRKPREW